MLDLNLTTIRLEAGQEYRELPGLYASTPKKAARLRAPDRLVLHLSQAPAAPAPGYSPLPPNLQQELLSRLAETYFTSTGSVTAGMKAVAERLNEFLINRNLRQSRQQSAQLIGMLTIAVVHGSFVYIAQAGPMHAYLIRGTQVEHYTDAGGPSRGLGLARAVNLRFFQVQIEDGMNLVFCSDGSAIWRDPQLATLAGLSMDDMRRALIGDALNLDAVLLHFVPGRGEVKLLLPVVQSTPAKPVETMEPSVPETVVITPAIETLPAQGIYLSGKVLENVTDQRPVESAAGEIGLESGQVGAEETTAPLIETAPAETTKRDLDIPPWEETKAETAHPEPTAPVLAPHPVVSQPLSGAERAARRWAQQSQPEAQAVVASRPIPDHAPRPAQEKQEIPRRSRQNPPSAFAIGAARLVTGINNAVRQVGARFGGMFNRLISRVLPDQPAEGMRLSPATMLFIALAVPVLVVAVSATVYFQRGRGQMLAAALSTARQYADRAVTQSDNALKREDWNQAQTWIGRAEKYGTNDDMIILRRRVQTGLDELDGLTRLEFRPALAGSMGEGVQIRRMLPVVNDVYLLDSSQNRVLRAFRSGQGYEIDQGFVCAAGNDFGGGNMAVGQLIDITTIPADNFVNAVLLAIDGRGNILLCSPGELPSAQNLLPPDINWGTLARAVHLNGILYVLDTQANQVYRYYYSDEQQNFIGAPSIYFDLQIPRLNDVIDIAVDEENLYLLHADGTMTSCFNSGASTQCDDPLPYGDFREGWPAEPLSFDKTSFVIMQSTQPPDPSLYVLDALGPSVYNMSHRRLNLQRIYSPYTDTGYPPAGKAPQAFAVTSNRRVLMAVDDRLYMAPLP